MRLTVFLVYLMLLSACHESRRLTAAVHTENINTPHMDNPYKQVTESLEKAYGKASDAGFGSAVFHAPADVNADAGVLALAHYKHFLGNKWTADREAAWMKPWKLVYSRPANAPGDILRELAAISDAEARVSIPLLTELIENADTACKALAAAFDHPDVRQLNVFTIGDGEAMSGILVHALYVKGYSCTVVALMD